MSCNEAPVEAKPKAHRCPKSSFAQLQPSSDPPPSPHCTAALVLLALSTI